MELEAAAKLVEQHQIGQGTGPVLAFAPFSHAVTCVDCLDLADDVEGFVIVLDVQDEIESRAPGATAKPESRPVSDPADASLVRSELAGPLQEYRKTTMSCSPDNSRHSSCSSFRTGNTRAAPSWLRG